MKKAKKKAGAKKAKGAKPARVTAKRVARKTSTTGVNYHKSVIGVTPLGDRVIVMAGGKEENMSKFGIIIPETVDKERPDQGTVVAVGPGKRDEDGKVWPVGVRVGDKVIFSKYGPDEIKVGDKEYFVIEEKNILAVIG